MAEFILKDWHGKEKTFDHETIYVRGTDGELMPFTHGTGNPVLEELEVTENGSYTPSEGVDGFSSVTVNVGVAKIAVLAEQEMTGFAPDSTWGYSTLDQAPSYTINEGEQYYVKWDGVTYPVMLTDGSAAIAGVKYLGNGSAFNLPGNGEPFAIVFVNGMILYTAMNDPKESHTIGIYKDGSAGSDELKYVTFKSYDGSVEHGKKAVAKGDDCADPLARGVFSTPTREADAQYTYTHYGWATEPNGGAVSNWNKAINEDKTVYANFSKAVRYYTITYYDSDGATVLETESLAYGVIPSYKPSKTGAVFSKWSPDLATVTGNASYTASWDEAVTFADMTWARIGEVSEAGQASNYFSIGDTRTEKLGSIGTVEMMIIGFNHDDKADGSGKAGISIGIVGTSTYNVQCGENFYGFSPEGDPLKKLCDAHYSNLPSELKNVMKSVTKKSTQWKDGAMSTYTFDASLWMFSLDELGVYNTGWNWNIHDGSKEYQAVTSGLFPKGASKPYWLRNQTNTLGWAMSCGEYGMSSLSNSYVQGKWMRYGFCI